jgi:7-cyano-7-deazaguanine reductase
MTTTDVSNLTQLGSSVDLPNNPDDAVLERVPNSQADVNYLVRFTAPEFTSVCPMTGQPDFAHIVIDYVPDAWLIESKSLKLYLCSFRNHGAFHEDCTLAIGKKVVGVLRSSLVQNRRLLVSARRHADRCLLADWCTARWSLASRSRCGRISGAGLAVDASTPLLPVSTHPVYSRFGYSCPTATSLTVRSGPSSPASSMDT